jgi:hypothetical protein|tara:strand:+ start:130 stop:1887 length:1758 start_codon:yes stop_codon:yes gene_type:complete
MGFWTDLGNLATGAIERDRENTAAKLQDRKDELKANRDFYIAQKQKKYESEMKAFEDEQKKYKAIQAVNAKFEGQEVNPANWSRDYLFNYKPELYNSIIKQADGDTELAEQLFKKQYSDNLALFTPSTTRDAVDEKIRKEVESITADYNTKIKNARGDSFLISKLIGEKSNKIKSAEKEITEGAKGIDASNKVIEETESTTTSQKKLPFKIVESDTVATFKAPKKFREKVEPIREKLNSSDSQDVYSKSAVNATLSFFTKNDIAKPRVFYKKNQQTNQVEGFEGAGAVLNEHLGELWGGATDGFTNEKIYLESGKDSSYISSVFNSSTISNKIKSRVNDYTYIEQPKTWFKDRESIVGIVPWSVVDVNDTIGNLALTSKADKKLAGEAYVKALRAYANKYNKTQQGTIIESNQKFINDLQTELLGLRGGSNNKSKEIQNMMLTILTPQKASNTGSEKTITVISTETGNTEIILDNEENRNMIKNNPKFKIQESKIEPQSIEGDVDEEYTEGTEFDVKPQKPVSQMTFEERREFEKKRSDAIKERNRKRNEEFNRKIKERNDRIRAERNNSLKSAEVKLPEPDSDV